MLQDVWSIIFFFFNDTATTEIYTLSLHDALPIYQETARADGGFAGRRAAPVDGAVLTDDRAVADFHPRFFALVLQVLRIDRKSTRLNSSHSQISYAVFCLKKKQFLLCVMTRATIY